MNGSLKHLFALILIASFAVLTESSALPKTKHGVQPELREDNGPRQVNPRAETPRFEDFPATERFRGKPAAVRLETREALKYRTMIRDGASEGPNFAGRYTIVQWGCGAGCVQFALVDAKSGTVFTPPFYVAPRALTEGQTGEPDEPLRYRIDSKLLIVNGSRNEKGEGIYYYKWEGKRLIPLKAVSSTK